MGAAEVFESFPFEIVEASNCNGDEFSVLYTIIPLDKYEELRSKHDSGYYDSAFSDIAEAISEIGTYIRIVAADLKLEEVPNQIADQKALKLSEISKLVNKYIGVSGGYLGDFTYRTHQEFYSELDLNIDPNHYSGTTRERFIKILRESSPNAQIRILEGILLRFPVGSSSVRTQERCDEIRTWILRLSSASPVQQPNLKITSQLVDRALADAEQLLKSTGAISGLDRVHTALHGYLRLICRQAHIHHDGEASMTELFKILRESHPAIRDIGHHQNEVTKIIRAMSTILDTLNSLRNRASIAHPNESLLNDPEAMLAINTSRTMFHYIDARLQNYKPC